MTTNSKGAQFSILCLCRAAVYACLVFSPAFLKYSFHYETTDLAAKTWGMNHFLHVDDGVLIAQAESPILTNPDWVPPSNRERYPGYQILEDAKKNSESWKYSTNRPGGKIKGSGTVKYRDYRSVTRQTRPDSGEGTGRPSGK